jgi:23S rRNA (guanosine2251-2'-O)-methyltransferase
MTEHYVYGWHAVFALLSNPQRKTHKIYINQERLDKGFNLLLEQALQKNIPIEKLSSQKMKQRFAEFSHQGVVASATPLPDYGESDLPVLLKKARNPSLILILDGVTDPHNLGACLRTADAAGVDFVITPKDRSASITPAVSKVACGAAESIAVVRVTNLVRAIEAIKKEGVWVYGATGEAHSSLYDIPCKGSLALIMGAEGEGLRRLTKEHCDDLFALPMLGTVESLNVSVAAGVCLYEVVRQRSVAD